MSAMVLADEERRTWGLAGAVALAAHAAALIALLLAVRPATEPLPEPVVLVELPAEAAPATEVAAAQPAQPAAPQSIVQPQMPAPPLDLPVTRAPLPADPVTLPPPSPVRAAPAPSPPQAPAPANAGRATSPIAGADPSAKKAEVDYRAIVNAYLARRKSYPVGAKQARQEGTVAIRFTVDRSGAVSDVRMIRGSGHQILDAATIALLQRVAPLPRMPASVQRDSMPMAVAIEYSLKIS